MCDIGKPQRMVNVEPLVLPAPLRKEQEPEPQPVVREPVRREKVPVQS
jgi:hypothetical protein